MARDSRPVFTFHKVRERCEAGDPQAWRGFLKFYAPLCLRLLAIYAPRESDSPQILESVFRALAENGCERLRAAPRESEREFLNELRALLLETALVRSPQTGDDRGIAAEKWKALAEGLPLTHQEMLFLKLAGYTDATIERMLRTAPAVAQQAFARLAPDFSAALRLEKDRCPWPRQWLALLREARAAKQENCPALHLFLRVHDGQVSWYDKEPMEKHVAGCLHCVDRWTALREVGYWRHAAAPMSEAQIEELLRALPVQQEAQEKRRWFR